jgi:hypothetical protein
MGVVNFTSQLLNPAALLPIEQEAGQAPQPVLDIKEK